MEQLRCSLGEAEKSGSANGDHSRFSDRHLFCECSGAIPGAVPALGLRTSECNVLGTLECKDGSGFWGVSIQMASGSGSVAYDFCGSDGSRISVL